MKNKTKQFALGMSLATIVATSAIGGVLLTKNSKANPQINSITYNKQVLNNLNEKLEVEDVKINDLSYHPLQAYMPDYPAGAISVKLKSVNEKLVNKQVRVSYSYKNNANKNVLWHSQPTTLAKDKLDYSFSVLNLIPNRAYTFSGFEVFLNGKWSKLDTSNSVTSNFKYAPSQTVVQVDTSKNNYFVYNIKNNQADLRLKLVTHDQSFSTSQKAVVEFSEVGNDSVIKKYTINLRNIKNNGNYAELNHHLINLEANKKYYIKRVYMLSKPSYLAYNYNNETANHVFKYDNKQYNYFEFSMPVTQVLKNKDIQPVALNPVSIKKPELISNPKLNLNTYREINEMGYKFLEFEVNDQSYDPNKNYDVKVDIKNLTTNKNLDMRYYISPYFEKRDNKTILRIHVGLSTDYEANAQFQLMKVAIDNNVLYEYTTKQITNINQSNRSVLFNNSRLYGQFKLSQRDQINYDGPGKRYVTFTGEPVNIYNPSNESTLSARVVYKNLKDNKLYYTNWSTIQVDNSTTYTKNEGFTITKANKWAVGEYIIWGLEYKAKHAYDKDVHFAAIDGLVSSATGLDI